MKSFKQYFFENSDINNLTLKTDSENTPIGGFNEQFRLYDNDNEVAYVRINVQPKYVNISALYVKPEYRQRGLAKKLLKIVTDKYENKDIHIKPYAYMDEPMSDEQLEHFYRKMGFVQTPKFPKGHLIKPK